MTEASIILGSESVPNLCYLCGQPLQGELNGDHVPPKQIFAHSIRQLHELDLLKVLVHKACNFSYQSDEDYFVSTLAPLAVDSYAGLAIVRDQADRAAAGRRLGLLETIRKEFDLRPSGIVLPTGKIVKRFQGERVGRVLWKIVRGLFFQHELQVLPLATVHQIDFCVPADEPLPELYAALNGRPSLGRYPAVFDYCYAQFEDADDVYLWAINLWDRLLVLVRHPDPKRGSDCAADVI
jgi:hypothetical protein